MPHYKIAPSILAADYANFEAELKRIETAGGDYVHIDIMDGHFVPNISFGADVVAAMRPHSKLVFDCHLMVSNPESHIETFAQAGADILTIHAEATDHIHGALQKIKAAGMKAGVVINPGTPIAAVEHVLDLVDQVLIMTVNPGFGGQAFIERMLDKIKDLAGVRAERKLDFDIEVDGGIDDRTIGLTAQAGANVFVAGSYVFKGEVSQKIERLRKVLDEK